MKTKNMMTSIMCILFVLCSLFSFANIFNISISAQAENNQTSSQLKTVCNDCYCGDEDDTYVSMENEKVHFLLEENINVSYFVSSDGTILDFEYSQSGFSVISSSIDENNGNRITLELSCLPSALEYSFIMKIKMSNGENVIAMLYAVQNEYGCFISPFSKDDAMQRYFDYAQESNIMTQDEYEAIMSELSKIDVVEEEIIDRPSTSINGTTTLATSSSETYVKGTLQWTDDAGNNHPLRRVMIRIYDKEPIGSTHLATTYADNEGGFSYTFDNPDGFWDFENGGNDIFIRVYAGTNNAMVENSSGDEYYYESAVSENVITGSTVTKNLTIGMSTDKGRAFQISQAILTARDYAWNMMGTIPEDVTIRYPYDSGCYYTRSAKRITITGNAPVSSSPNSYASWDVLMHEYGHHIQYQVGIIDSPGGSHSSSQNNADKRSNKDEGVRLAWAESWPTVFGTMAQRYYSSYLSNIATVGDTSYTSYNGLNYDIETTNICLGDACERSIMAVLWDLYDSANDTNDTISLGYTKYWAVTTGNQSKTFSDFMGYFYDTYPSYIDDIGTNLTYYKMATSMPSLSNPSSISQTVPPKFSWTPQGGSSSYPNNSFSLLFYDGSGKEVLRTATTTSNTYTLTQSEWDSVLYSYGTTYTVAVAAIQTDSPTTGEYISARSATYTKPTPTNLTQTVNISANSRYTERIVNLQPGQYIDYSVTFATGETQLIQTFGSKDARIYLYDSAYNLLEENNDSGYSTNALLSYTVEADTTYIIRVKFYSKLQFGEIKLGITPASSTYSAYEDIWNSSASSVTYYFSTALNTTMAITYTPTESGTYKFTTGYQGDTKIDTYLYVIDPYSTSNCLYNDDSAGDLQASLTTELEAGRTYFIIVSAYNITTTSGSMMLNIKKIS